MAGALTQLSLYLMHGRRSLPILQHVSRWRRSTYQKIKSVAEISKKFIPRVLLNECSARLKNSITWKRGLLKIPCPAVSFLSLLTWRHIVSHQEISTNSYIQIPQAVWLWARCSAFLNQVAHPKSNSVCYNLNEVMNVKPATYCLIQSKNSISNSW